jgi:hypothetical protein
LLFGQGVNIQQKPELRSIVPAQAAFLAKGYAVVPLFISLKDLPGLIGMRDFDDALVDLTLPSWNFPSYLHGPAAGKN